MQAVTLTPTALGTRELSVTTSHPVPEAVGHEALIRVTLAGICGTDLELLSGYKTHAHAQVLGHEFVGRLLSYGARVTPSQRLPAGTRVVCEINCVSAASPSRTAHARAHDPARTALGIFGHDGAFAQLLAVPAVNVHAVPDGVPDDVAVFAEPMAAACEILTQVALPRVEPVAVLGAGRLGWLVAGVLCASGCEVIVLSRGRERDERLAAEFRVGVERVDEVTEERFEVVVDCTGASSGLEVAMRVVRPRGTIVLKSTAAAGKAGKVDLTPVVVKEVTIVGSRCGPFPVALRLMRKMAFDPRVLVDGRFELKDAREAFAMASRKGTLKVLLVPPS